MKLFLFDRKHQQVHASLDLGDADLEAVHQVIDFLDAQGITNRYKSLVVADGYKVEYEEGEPEVEFF